LAWKYPCNKKIIEEAQGVIVHSDNSRRLADQWIGGENFSNNWSVIPLLRVPTLTNNRAKARLALNINEDAFVVASFGLLGPMKKNKHLLDAWLASSLIKDKRCLLIFVGENDGGIYGAELVDAINRSGCADRISIAGWTDAIQFRQYLAAADMGVQLRMLSRGETSGTALDCMNYGLPTIVNSHGSLADLSTDAVCMLPDEFAIVDLSNAIETIWKDEEYRNRLGQEARKVIHVLHAPRICADQYFEAIEKYSKNPQLNSGQNSLIQSISKIEPTLHDDYQLLAVAKKISQNQAAFSEKKLFLDISILVQCDAKSGIQRVVRSLLSDLLINPPKGFRVEPVYAVPNQAGYYYARKFTLRFLDCPDHSLDDDPVEPFSEDIFLALDLAHYAVEQQTDFYFNFRRVGGQVYFLIFDLLPVLNPNFFPENVATVHDKWLTTLAKSDGVVCISRSVADEMMAWLCVFGPERLRPLKLGWFHLGADVAMSVPTKGLPDDANHILMEMASRPTFLMVGTIEPRKGQKQTQAAFDLLWAQHVDVNLVIVGKCGWNVEKLVEQFKRHPENNKRLYWLENVTDEYLEKIYAASTCLIAASEGEGFGLPLIEAAQHKLPIIARDIPVFREVVGAHGFYFSGLTFKALADSVQAWLALDKAGQAPQSDTMPWLTWKQSTQHLLDVILSDQWYQKWMPDDVHRFWGGDSRLGTQVGKSSGRDVETTSKAGYLIFGPYLALAAGQYRVLIRGTLGANGLAGARMDAVANRGELILGEAALGAPDDDGCLVTLTISLEAPCADLETRVWVEELSELTISMVEIHPFDGAEPAVEKVAPHGLPHQPNLQLVVPPKNLARALSEDVLIPVQVQLPVDVSMPAQSQPGKKNKRKNRR
jgi:glycosyltransferase involved in cell wall biosynthesis